MGCTPVGTGTNAQDTRSQTVLIAHSMRMYREVTAFAFAQLRPSATIISVDPSRINTLSDGITPALLISDVPIDSMMDRSSAWILLSDSHPYRSTMCINGEVLSDVYTDLALILEVFDQSVRLRNET